MRIEANFSNIQTVITKLQRKNQMNQITNLIWSQSKSKKKKKVQVQEAKFNKKQLKNYHK